MLKIFHLPPSREVPPTAHRLDFAPSHRPPPRLAVGGSGVMILAKIRWLAAPGAVADDPAGHHQGCTFLPGRVGGVRSEAFFTYPPTLHNLLAEEGRPYPPTLSPDDEHSTPKPNGKIGGEEIIHNNTYI